jgi:hypothetical protein
VSKIIYRRQPVYYDRNTCECPPEMPEAKHRLERHQNPISQHLSRIVRDPRRDDAEFAESYLNIARLLLAYGKTDVARRRLKRVVDKFGNTPAGCESRKLLTTMEVTSPGRQLPQANRAVEPGRGQ